MDVVMNICFYFMSKGFWVYLYICCCYGIYYWISFFMNCIEVVYKMVLFWFKFYESFFSLFCVCLCWLLEYILYKKVYKCMNYGFK